MITTGTIVLFVLGLMALSDYFTKTVPSIIPTSVIFGLTIIIGTLQPQSLVYGLCGGILGLLLWEAGFFKGLADIKVSVILGLSTGTFNNFVWFCILLIISSLILSFSLFLGNHFVASSAKIKGKERKKDWNIPFIPVLFIVYVILYFMELTII